MKYLTIFGKSSAKQYLYDIESLTLVTSRHFSKSSAHVQSLVPVLYVYECMIFFFQVIRGAGHHVYADYPGMFNLLVNRACENVDQEGKETD